LSSDLHTAGWRQGSVFDAKLEAMSLTLDGEDVKSEAQTFTRWVVCTQDCDLRSAATDSDVPCVELRPVAADDPPVDWGIRSRRLRLTEGLHVDASEPRCHVTPRLLQHFRAARFPSLDEGRARALKTWLGLRYDRPAVPDHLVDLAREVAKRCGSQGGRATAESVHEVLMQFGYDGSTIQVALFAVIADSADAEVVRVWLADAARRIRPELGVVARLDVGTRAETSLELLETSYAADLSQLTWRGIDPTGAE